MLPTIKPIKQSKSIINKFMGISNKPAVSDGYFSKYENISSDAYPVAKTRDKRGFIFSPTSPAATRYITGIAPNYRVYNPFYDNFIYTYQSNNTPGAEKATFVMGEETVEFDTIYSGNTKRKIVMFGSYYLIFPDRFYVNSNDITDKGKIGNEVKNINTPPTEPSWSGTSITFAPCDEDGNPLQNLLRQQNAPNNPSEGDWWYDTANKIYKYYTSAGEWFVSYRVYTKMTIQCDSRDAEKYNFLKGNSSFTLTRNTTTEFTDNWLFDTHIAERVIVSTVADTMINVIIKGELTNTHSFGTQAETKISISSLMPACTTETIFEHNNRLWCAMYGINNSGDFVNEIYASALGDFKTWQRYDEIADSSYAVSVGEAEPFTAGISYNGYPTFFKENYIYRVYGDYPANYQIAKYAMDGAGVKNGCGYSLQVINRYLYYFSNNGIMRYNGGNAVKISDALGNYTDYTEPNAISAQNNGKYYICFNISNQNKMMFVYDTYSSVWSSENIPIGLSDMASTSNGIYGIAENEKCVVSDFKNNEHIETERHYTSDNKKGGLGISVKNYSGDIDPSDQFITADYINYYKCTNITYPYGDCKFLHISSTLVKDIDDRTIIYKVLYKPGEINTIMFIAGCPDSFKDETVSFEMETGDMEIISPDRKYLTLLQIRAEISLDAILDIAVKYDGELNFTDIKHLENQENRAVTINIIPKRKDHFRLKLYGYGDVTIYNIVKTIEKSSNFSETVVL